MCIQTAHNSTLQAETNGVPVPNPRACAFDEVQAAPFTVAICLETRGVVGAVESSDPLKLFADVLLDTELIGPVIKLVGDSGCAIAGRADVFSGLCGWGDDCAASNKRHGHQCAS